MSQRITNREIEELHHATVQARQKVATVDDPDQERTDADGNVTAPSPRELLQRTVSGYFEALRSSLVSTPEGEKYYYGEAPDSADDLGYGVLERRQDEKLVELSNLPDPGGNMPSISKEQHYEDAIASLLPEGQNLLRPVEYITDREEPAAYALVEEYRTGLRILDDLYRQRREVQVDQNGSKYGGDLMAAERGREPETQTKLELLPLPLLMNAARELDRAASELDLLAETGESNLKPYMSDYSNGTNNGEVGQAEITGTPDV